MSQQTRWTASFAIAGILLAGCGGNMDSDPEPTVTVTVEPVPEAEPEPEPVVTDADQLRFYEAMRAASGWESATDATLDEVADAACTDLRAYTGAPELAVTSMEFTFGEELGDDDLGKAAVSALIKRWCPEILE